ncbi:metal-dependent hydrolase [Heliomicrobium modesticaldum Ice1]|uniref:UPF0173 metal-dependent hydrolase Helmi_16730 n=1 Tax=Heliobacterium modesticaldum (strain ATCC 51547 / Ice1) TaxID=498761 RepID=Y1673_HELMI|nr:metal-dependent hydrolase [Heliomicrobium modesticaldum]B0TEP6.1 RecName: Full=UPF0173 metal-dependent hydrolase Helmi_16730 [Heliomicrobium modesticaldum Ice1]ABZ84298.1 metal-dependent hydrolase [Heliomicrobium modesticaldum Ice1]
MLHVTFFGHANFLLDDGQTKVLIDPFFTGNPVCPIKADAVSADYILVSHGHGDHLGDAIDIAKGTGATIISSFELASYCQRKGVKAHGMAIGGKRDFPFGRVRLTAAVHGSGIIEGDNYLDVGNPCGFLVNMGGKSVYHAGDTGLTRDMELINMCFLKGGRLDLALLPIGDNFGMGPEDALYATKMLHPRMIVPMHYNTFPVIEQDVAAFKRVVTELTDSECHVLAPGDTLTLNGHGR